MLRSGRLIRQNWRCLMFVIFGLTAFVASASSALAAAQPFGAIAGGKAATIPEPASWALLATGVGAIGWLVRKRRTSSNSR